MPKKKSKLSIQKNRYINEASKTLETAIQSSQSSLLPYTDNASPLNCFVNAGFQVCNDLDHSAFIATFSSWLINNEQSGSPNQYYINSQYALEPAHPVTTPLSTTTLLPYTANQSEDKLPILAEKKDIPCEIRWETEPNNTFQTMVLTVLFSSRLPFGERQYNFSCFSADKDKLLSEPLTTADPFVIQHYKCAMEWFQLISTSYFSNTLSNKDFTHLVTYQITYDSLSQMIDILHVYLSYHQNTDTPPQEIFQIIKKNANIFSSLTPPEDIFQQASKVEQQEVSKVIEQQLEKLTAINRAMTWTLMAQGLELTKDHGISAFHRISPDLIVYIQNGPFSDSGACSFTGLLSWFHSLMLLPKIAELAQYTVETSILSGRFLNENYIGKKLEFTPDIKTNLVNSPSNLSSLMEKEVNERIKGGGNLYKLPNLEPEVFLTKDVPSVVPLMLQTDKDLAKQLFDYLKASSTPFASPFSHYVNSAKTTPVSVHILGTIFNRLAALAKYCADSIIMPLIRLKITGNTGKKQFTHLNLHSLVITIGEHTFSAYPEYLSGDNHLLIKDALYTQLEIRILGNLIEDAKQHEIHPEVSKNFYQLFQSYFQDYFTLLTHLETCTNRARIEFITQHNTDLKFKSDQAAKELIAEEKAKAKSQAPKKKKQATKSSCQPKSTGTTSETDKTEALNLPKEDTLQKQLNQLQSKINAITKATNHLPTLHSTQEKINYLMTCIASLEALEALLRKNEKESEATVDLLKAVLSVEIFYYHGLLSSYQATQYFEKKTINHFNALLSIFKTLKNKLTHIDLCYADLLATQDTIPKESSSTKTLEALLTNITSTASIVEDTIKKIKESLQQDFDRAQQKPKKPKTLNQTSQQPLHISVPPFRDLLGFLNLEIAMKNLDEVSGELSNCSRNFKPKQEENAAKPSSSRSYFFLPEINRQQTAQNNDEKNQAFPVLR